MYELYYSQGACSLAVHVVLIELGVPFTLHDVSGDKKKKPDYLAINPRGNVPVLMDDGFRIREGAAILLHLLEKHENSLLLKAGKGRAAALEWLMYCNASLHPATGRAFGILGGTMEQHLKEEMLAQTVRNASAMWKEVDEHLGKSRYLAGEQLTVADILLTVFANWLVRINNMSADNAPKFILGENVKRLIREVYARPSFQKALAAEQMEYKAAA